MDTDLLTPSPGPRIPARRDPRGIRFPISLTRGGTDYHTVSNRLEDGLKGLSEPAKRGEWMRRVVNRTESEGQTSADRSPCTLTPLPRATHPGAPGPTWNKVS